MRVLVATKWLSAATTVILTSGCIAVSESLAPSSPDQPWSPKAAATDSATSENLANPGRGFLLPPDSQAVSITSTKIYSDRFYNLSELIDISLSSNPDTRVSWIAARNAALAVEAAKSTYLPRVSISALHGEQYSKSRSDVAGLSNDQSNRVNGSLATISLQWLLFDFGKREATVEIAKQSSVISNINFTSVHQKLIQLISVSYYDYAVQKARGNNLARSLKDAADIQEAVEVKLRSGEGTIVEVAQARQLTAQAEFEKVQAEGRAKAAYVRLLSAMGISPLSKINISGDLQTPIPTDIDNVLAKVVADALARRPDVLAMVARQKIAVEEVKSAKANFAPKFFLSASGTRAQGNLQLDSLPSIDNSDQDVNISNGRWGSSVILGVTLPLYTGGLRRTALAQAQNRIDGAEEEMKRVQLTAAQEVVASHTELKTALASYRSAKEFLESSTILFNAALTAYQNGVGTVSETLTAERQLIVARNAVTDSHGLTLTAAANLALACGTLGSAPTDSQIR